MFVYVNNDPEQHATHWKGGNNIHGIPNLWKSKLDDRSSVSREKEVVCFHRFVNIRVWSREIKPNGLTHLSKTIAFQMKLFHGKFASQCKLFIASLHHVSDSWRICEYLYFVILPTTRPTNEVPEEYFLCKSSKRKVSIVSTGSLYYKVGHSKAVQNTSKISHFLTTNWLPSPGYRYFLH